MLEEHADNEELSFKCPNKSPSLAQPRMKLENVRVCNISNSYTSDRLDRLRCKKNYKGQLLLS